MAISSLFGPTPAELMLAQQKEAQQMQMLRNQQIAQEGAEFGPFRALYQAGRRFGDVASQAAVQGLFPQQMDPRLQEATAVQSILSKYSSEDQTDPTVLTKIGRELMSVAPNAGIKAISLAQQLTKDSPFAKIDPSKFTPESIATYEKTRKFSDLEPLEGGAKPTSEWVGVARELGLPAKNSFGDYEPSQVAAVNSLLSQRRLAEASAKGTKVVNDLGGALREAIAKAEGKNSADAWAKAGEAYKLSVPLLAELEVANSKAQNAFFGFGARGKIGLSKALSAAGIPISERASDSEFLDAMSSKLVQRIAKNFPGSQAIKELEQLIKSKPNLEQEASTFMRLLNNVTTEFKAETIAYEKLSEMPQEERYKQDFNVFTGKIYKQITRYQSLEAKVRNKSASLEEANEALSLKRSLGL